MASFNNNKPTSTAAVAAAAIAAISTFGLLLPQPNWPLFRRFCLFFLSILLRLFDLIVSHLLPPPPSSSSYAAVSNSPSSSLPTTRALSHLLTIISFIPVSSQKYYFARSLADRLLDDNLISSPIGVKEVNCVALSDAFERRMRRLEAVVARAEIWGWRRWFGVNEKDGGGEVMATEKVAGEVMWLAEKMAECGAVGDAVARWAAAAELGRSALNVEARIQVAFVRVSGKKIESSFDLLLLSSSTVLPCDIKSVREFDYACHLVDAFGEI